MTQQKAEAMEHGELIARLEAASEGSRELDAAILSAIGDQALDRGRFGWEWRPERVGFWRPMPEPTTSIDAIVALIERKLPVLADFYIAQHRGSARATIWLDGKPFDGVKEGRDKPLAACIAFLRALRTQDQGDQTNGS